jgi:ABC-type transport system involved in cytochrome bd biosynthesis fused ATPase/permease subunit
MEEVADAPVDTPATNTPPGIGFCAPEPLGTTLWGVAFHIALFSTFFATFFQFALRDQYAQMQSKVAQMFAGIAASSNLVTPAAQRSIRSELGAFGQRANAAFRTRSKSNDTKTMLSLIPVATVWVIVIVWGAALRAGGHMLLPSIRGGILMFFAFLAAEMVIFAVVVKKYVPIQAAGLVDVYQKAFRRAVKKACAPGNVAPQGTFPIAPAVRAQLG